MKNNIALILWKKCLQSHKKTNFCSNLKLHSFMHFTWFREEQGSINGLTQQASFSG
jgi:hypothetical protein